VRKLIEKIYLPKKAVKKVIKEYVNESVTICGLCHYPYALIELSKSFKEKYKAKYALIKYEHTHSSDWSVYRLALKFFNDLGEAPKDLSDCHKIFDEAFHLN